MLRKKDKSKTHRLPTVYEFLRYRPKRAELEWSTNDDGLIQIQIPKFQSNLGKSFCRVLRKDNTFSANMDKLGSLIWKQCSGEKTVKEILEMVKKEFPKEENIDQRLFLFLQQLHNLHYINL